MGLAERAAQSSPRIYLKRVASAWENKGSQEFNQEQRIYSKLRAEIQPVRVHADHVPVLARKHSARCSPLGKLC